jgi:hypothetical protein
MDFEIQNPHMLSEQCQKYTVLKIAPSDLSHKHYNAVTPCDSWVHCNAGLGYCKDILQWTSKHTNAVIKLLHQVLDIVVHEKFALLFAIETCRMPLKHHGM